MPIFAEPYDWKEDNPSMFGDDPAPAPVPTSAPVPAPAPAPVVPTPIPAPPPVFNPLDPISLSFYIGTVLTVIGFVLHKDLSNYAGPVALAVTALVGIAIGIIHAIKYGAWMHALTNINLLLVQQDLHQQDLAMQRIQLDTAYPDRVSAIPPQRGGKAAPVDKPTPIKRVRKTSDGKVDGRTKEGRAAKAAAESARSRRP